MSEPGVNEPAANEPAANEPAANEPAANESAQTPASDQLAAIRAVEGQMGPAQARGRRQLAGLCIGLGVLLGAMHLIVVAVPPDENLPAFLVACGVVVVAILLLTFGYVRVRRIRPAGGGRRYLVALMASVVLHSAALLLVLLVGETLPIAIGVAVVIAAPLLIAAIWELRR